MWPATVFSVPRESIQNKTSNLKYVEKRVRLHLFSLNENFSYFAVDLVIILP